MHPLFVLFSYLLRLYPPYHPVAHHNVPHVVRRDALQNVYLEIRNFRIVHSYNLDAIVVVVVAAKINLPVDKWVETYLITICFKTL
jgi:hypothetical protein